MELKSKIKDSEMDILMEEITEKLDEAETSDLGCSSKKRLIQIEQLVKK